MMIALSDRHDLKLTDDNIYLAMIQSSQSIVDLEEENYYQVEEIVAKRAQMVSGHIKPFYFIKWVGFPELKDHTWEPLQNLASVKKMVDEFQKKQALKRTNKDKQKKQREGNADEELRQKNQRKRLQEELKYQQRKEQKQQQRKQQMQKARERKEAEVGEKNQRSKLIYYQKSKQRERRKEQIRRHDQRSRSRSNSSAHRPQSNENQRQSQKKKTLQKVRQLNPKPKISLQIENHNNNTTQDVKMKKLKQSNESPYGRVIAHIYDKGELSYQIQKISNNCQHTVILPSKIAKQKCQSNVVQYLQRLLIKQECSIQ